MADIRRAECRTRVVKYLDRRGVESTASTSDASFDFRRWCDRWGYTLIWVKCTNMAFEGYVQRGAYLRPWSATYYPLDGKLWVSVSHEPDKTYMEVKKELPLSEAKILVNAVVETGEVPEQYLDILITMELTATPIPMTPHIGEPMTLTGSLRRIDTGTGIPNQNIYLYLSPDTLLSTTQTDANGNYELTWTPTAEGTYTIFTRFEGAEV